MTATCRLTLAIAIGFLGSGREIMATPCALSEYELPVANNPNPVELILGNAAAGLPDALIAFSEEPSIAFSEEAWFGLWPTKTLVRDQGSFLEWSADKLGTCGLGRNYQLEFASIDHSQPYLILDSIDERPIVPLQSKWQLDGQQLIATTNANLTAAKLSTTVTLAESDAHLDPGRPRTWGADQSVNMPLAGPLFAYGQFGASTPTVDEQPGVRWQSKYGVGVKLKPGIVDELQVRGGPALRSDDSGRLVRSYNGEKSELFIEAITRFGIPIVGTLNFECTSYAVPAATAGEHSQVNQDFRLARALPSGGQVHVGARYRWEELAGTSPVVERTQVYLGLQLKR